MNLPPYPAKAPQEIETGEETLGRIIAALEADAGAGREGAGADAGLRRPWATTPSET